MSNPYYPEGVTERDIDSIGEPLALCVEDEEGELMSEEKQLRGMLTERIKKSSVKLLGYEIGTLELRLMPYILHVMINERKIDIRKVTSEERKILQIWRDKKYIEGGASGLRITKEFWHIITEIVFLGYVDLSD